MVFELDLLMQFTECMQNYFMQISVITLSDRTHNEYFIVHPFNCSNKFDYINEI